VAGHEIAATPEERLPGDGGEEVALVVEMPAVQPVQERAVVQAVHLVHRDRGQRLGVRLHRIHGEEWFTRGERHDHMGVRRQVLEDRLGTVGRLHRAVRVRAPVGQSVHALQYDASR